MVAGHPAAQVAPPVPQAGNPFRHMPLASQQPPAQEFASQTHAPFEHSCPGTHRSVHGTLCPQLFVPDPQDLPLHAIELSGTQHVSLERHTPAFGHVAAHIAGCPQLLVTVVLHLPAQAVALSGVQHMFPTQTSPPVAHDVVPLAPHATACPQLFMAVPQVFPWQVIEAGSGTQPHAPFVHVRPPSQPPHMIIWPQLSMEGPQRFWHHVDAGVGEQHVLLDVQTPPLGQVPEQLTVCPQLFIADVLHLPMHAAALSGVQHVPSDLHASPPEAHDVVPLAPQPTGCPQLFVAEPQFFPAHVLAACSGTHPHAPDVHVVPPGHWPQSTGLLQLSY
jgi:hypothetical protein